MEATPEFLEALASRDEQALARLYDHYGGAVFALALRITHDRGIAEEITVDAFFHVWQQAARLAQELANVPAWLFTVTRSRAIDRLRTAAAAKRTINVDLPERAANPTPDDIADLSQRRQLVRRALAELEPGQRELVELAYYQGLSHTEIAARLGAPLGTVKTRLRQSMMLLRQALAPLLSSPT